MEKPMQRLALALAATAALVGPLSAPAAAQSLAVLLPALTFPEPVTVPSTKGCEASAAPVCRLQE